MAELPMVVFPLHCPMSNSGRGVHSLSFFLALSVFYLHFSFTGFCDLARVVKAKVTKIWPQASLRTYVCRNCVMLNDVTDWPELLMHIVIHWCEFIHMERTKWVASVTSHVMTVWTRLISSTKSPGLWIKLCWMLKICIPVCVYVMVWN